MRYRNKLYEHSLNFTRFEKLAESKPWRPFVHLEPEQAESSDAAVMLEMRPGGFKTETGSCN